MKRKTLSWLIALAVVASAWHLTSGNLQAGWGWGYAYYPNSYYYAPPVYAAPPVLVTNYAYPYYAVPYTVSYAPVYRPAPVYYAPPAVTTYYGGYPGYYGGKVKVKYKYRRGLFHDHYKYEVEYDD